MLCEMCGKEHNGSYGSGRFCSSSCARKFSSSNINDEELKLATCLTCGKEIFIKKRCSAKKCFCETCLHERKLKRYEENKQLKKKAKKPKLEKDIVKVKICPYCNKQFSTNSGCGSHVRYCAGNPNRIENPVTREDVRMKLSIRAKEYHSLHENLKVGKGKRGWYKGIYCQSSWELAYLIFQLEHNVNIQRNTKSFKYMWLGKEHHYFPDFYIPDINQYVEIKGYYSDRDKCKINQFPGKIVVLTKEKLQYILDYVETFYGNDFTKMYEQNSF